MLPAAVGFHGQAGMLNCSCIFVICSAFEEITAPEDRV